MKERENDIFSIGVIAGILLIFAVVDFFARAGFVSAKYGESGLKPPAFNREHYASGEFAREYEAYLRENFRNQAEWKALLTDIRLRLGRKDVGGVYVGREDTYLMRRPAEDITPEMEQKALEALASLVEDREVRVMLVPTSDAVWKDRLPDFADSYDQKSFLDRAAQVVGEENWVDAWSALVAHEGEEIYYRTDPHWTSLGAYYGYLAWWRDSGKLLPYYYDPNRGETAAEDVRGELYALSGLEMPGEKMWIFSETLRHKPALLYDTGERREGYYREDLLESADPYQYFLGEETGFLEIRTGLERRKSLLVIRDSYANCMIPLLAPHYQTIYLADPGLYEGGLEELLQRFGPEEDLEVLVLSSVPGWLENFR